VAQGAEEEVLGAVSRQKTMALKVSQLSAAGWG